ncbi:hypothetical protein MMC30_002401 [Trapelia coarctata]|nr:hypothetical protein [Trapelia coarctata]
MQRELSLVRDTIDPGTSHPEGSQRSSNVDPPPDGGIGWIQVGVCFTINCFTWGQIASYSVYLAYYLSHDIFPGATPLDYAFIGSFNFSMAMLVSPAVTIIARRYGTQAPMLLGILLQTSGFVSASFAREIWQLYLSQGLLVGLGQGFVYIPSIAILSQWFTKKRSLANGISAAGSGIGGLIFSFAASALISNVSLAWSLRITAAITASMNVAATLLIRNRNEAIRPPQRGFDMLLLRRYDVLLLLMWGFISMLGYMTLLYSLSDFAHSIGLDYTQAASVAAYLNLGTAVGRPLIGISSDRYGRMEVAGLLTFLCGVSCFAIWLPAISYGVTVFFALISGAILGVYWTIGPLCVEVAGLAELPSLLSLSWLSVVIPTLFSEAITLKIRQPGTSREYIYAQIFAGSSYIIASVCMYKLRVVTRISSMPPVL